MSKQKIKEILTLKNSLLVLLCLAGVLGISLPALAAYTPTAGDKVKVTKNPALYYIGTDLKRHLFSTLSTYESWYGLSTAKGYWAAQGVKTISQADFENIVNGARVTVRPGSILKFENSGKYYAVGLNKQLAELADEATAKTLYGIGYKTKAKIVSASFEADYDESAPKVTADNPKYPDGAVISLNEEIYLIQNGQKRKFITGDALVINGYTTASILAAPVNYSCPTGEPVIDLEELIAKPFAVTK
jgi:hypothetical protein